MFGGMLYPMCECSSLGLCERYEEKQGLPLMLHLKCSTSSCRYICEFFVSSKVNRGFEINQQIVYTMWSLGHAYAGIEKLILEWTFKTSNCKKL